MCVTVINLFTPFLLHILYPIYFSKVFIFKCNNNSSGLDLLNMLYMTCHSLICACNVLLKS